MVEWVRRLKWVIAIATVVAVAVVAWQWIPWPESASDAPEEHAAETPAQEEPLVFYGPEVPLQWAWVDIPWRSSRFTPPPGHWVYFARWKREFLILPGEPLPLGAPAPDEEALYNQAAVIITEAYFDQQSFSSWEEMELTMAEFACARGTTEEDFTLCRREPSGSVQGMNPFGLPYRSFILPKVSYQTKESLGVAPFTVVRLGPNGTFALVFYAVDPVRGPSLMRAMAQSLERTVQDAAFLNQ